MKPFAPHKPVYLDFQATTPVDPVVLDEMLPYFTEKFGNPSSRSHTFGWQADAAVTHARERVAAALGATPTEIVFTSCATESNHLAIRGAARANKEKGRHLIVSAIEHKAILEPAYALVEEGFSVTELPVNPAGQVEISALKAAIRPDTILVSVMAANNETAVLQPILEIGALCKERGILFHTDATQAIGKIPLDVQTIQADLLSLSGHKLYGPKGVGALYIRRRKPRVAIEPFLLGGGQERGMRSGTLNVPGIVGLAKAMEIAVTRLPAEMKALQSFRDRAWEAFRARIPGAVLHGHPTERLPHALNVSFPGVHSEALIVAMRDVAVSSGAACASVGTEPSYVLRAMGIPEDVILSSIRMSFGRTTTEEEFHYAVEKIIETALAVREASRAQTGDEGEDHDHAF